MNYLFLDVMTSIGYECHYATVFKTIYGMLEFCFQLDVLSGDLNGFIFVYSDVYYHQYITNNVAIMALVINKVIGVSLTAVATVLLPKTLTCNSVCITFFSSLAFYLSSIPFLVCISISIPIIFYMSYTKYNISKSPRAQNNLTNPQVPAV